MDILKALETLEAQMPKLKKMAKDSYGEEPVEEDEFAMEAEEGEEEIPDLDAEDAPPPAEGEEGELSLDALFAMPPPKKKAPKKPGM